ncbi:MAG: Ppx/GppA phosphatase family protein [FCB group bacterium]|jgi:exopolyphosphatase/guanosine-5'-triphosphate,3'-diphosphate pyrophosphatase
MVTKPSLIAAIDVGTNSFHLVIASVNNRGMLQIYSREREVVRLGSSGKDMKYILPDAMERGIKTLKNFASLAQSQHAEIRAVATSAVREAMNKNEFLEKVFSETGINIEVISGAEEGRLIYIGAIHSLPILQKKALVIDIGGGSTETIIGHNGDIKYVNSVKLGAIRQTLQFFNDEKPYEEQIKQCRDFIKGDWFPVMHAIYEIDFDTLVGTSGTIQNIAVMALAERGERLPDILNGISISRNDLLNVINKIIKAKSIKQKMNIPGLDASRADIILAGALILEYAILSLNISKIIISSFALREGIVFDTEQKKKEIHEYHHLTHLRFETINNLCHRYDVNIEHATHVKNLAMQIFDGLQVLHKLGFEQRELLEAAAMLHDVGYHISHDQHHKHSYYIISQSTMPGFTNNESELIANIARYHRKSNPKIKHDSFGKLNIHQQNIVCILAGILRIAEGLDRRQIQAINNVIVNLNPKEIILKLGLSDSVESAEIEIWGANRRKELLELKSGKNILFEN